MTSFGKIAVLDIETTGLLQSDRTALIGVMEAGAVRQYLSHDFKDVRVTCDTLLSYNGRRFDLPFLERALPDYAAQIQFERHVDLMESARQFLCNDGKPVTAQTHFISKDQACRMMGIYVPKDPAGSGFRCALIGRRMLSPELPPDDFEVSEVALHNATDLYATLALFKVFLHEGWV